MGGGGGTACGCECGAGLVGGIDTWNMPVDGLGRIGALDPLVGLEAVVGLPALPFLGVARSGMRIRPAVGGSHLRMLFIPTVCQV